MPAILVLLAAACFGTTGTAQAFGPEAATPTSVGAARILIGGLGLAVIAIIARRASGRAFPPLVSLGVRAGNGSRMPGWVPLVLGALGVLAYQPAFFLGTAENGVAVGTIVALGSAPVITGAIDWLLNRRYPGIKWLIATVIATFGVALLSGILSASAGVVMSVPGLLGSLGAGVSYAVYTLASKALLDRGWTPSGSMGGVFGLAGVFSIPVLLLTDMSWLFTAQGATMALWLGLVTTTLAYVLFARGLAKLQPATVSTLTLGEPLTATLLGILVLHETLAPSAAIGLVVLAAGILILGWPRRRLVAPL